jgi:D-sedoheptulose 7-phosphate isomerase
MKRYDDVKTGWNDELDSAEQVLATVRAALSEVDEISQLLVQTLRSGGTIFACGNGGSALEAQHFAAELVGHFRRERAPLRCVALSADTGVITALANDYDYREVFARQLLGLAKPGDALLAFSTSGTSPNVVEAVRAARTIGMRSIALTGGDGGIMPNLADRVLVIRGADTQRAQEAHLLLVHLIAESIDAAFAKDAR